MWRADAPLRRSGDGTAIGAANATLLIGECALPDHDTIGVPPVMYQIDIQMMGAFGDAQELDLLGVRDAVGARQPRVEEGHLSECLHLA